MSIPDFSGELFKPKESKGKKVEKKKKPVKKIKDSGKSQQFQSKNPKKGREVIEGTVDNAILGKVINKKLDSNAISYMLDEYQLSEALKYKTFDVLVQDSALLKLAAKTGNLAILKMAVDAGANPAAGNNEAIYWASENGHDQIVEYLLKCPNVNVKDVNNRALKVAKENNFTRIVTLLENGSKYSEETFLELLS